MAGSVRHVAMQVALYCLGILTGLGMSLDSKRKKQSPNHIRRDREYKMVLVVNSSLKMGKGKIGMLLLSPMCCMSRFHGCLVDTL